MTQTTAESTAEPGAEPAQPLFVRPREGRMFAGVCAGVAERWNVDVTLVRIAAVVLALLSGIGVAAYVAAWLLTPSDDAPAPIGPDHPMARSLSARGGRAMRRFPRLLLIVLLAALVIGVAHSLWFGVPLGVVVAAAILVLVFGTRLGRWAVAGFAAVVALLVAVVGIFGTSFGTRSLNVSSVDDLRSSYDYGAGAVHLDLSSITAVSGEHETAVHLGRGDVTVTLPPGVPVLVHARAGVGSVTVDGHRESGIDPEQTVPVGAGSATATDRLVLDVTVGAGSVDVHTG